MKKRIVSLLMALVMAVSLLPTSVFAVETVAKDYLADIIFYSDNARTSACTLTPAFSPSKHEYTVIIPDATNPVAYINLKIGNKAPEGSKGTVESKYLNAYGQEKTQTKTTDKNATFSDGWYVLQGLQFLQTKTHDGNTITVTVGTTGNFGEYTFAVKRQSTLGQTALKSGLDNADADFTKYFEKSLGAVTSGYTAYIPYAGAYLDAIPSCTKRDEVVTVNGKDADETADNMARTLLDASSLWQGEAGSRHFDLQLKVESKDENNTAIPTTYTINCYERPAKLEIATQPTQTKYLSGDTLTTANLAGAEVYACYGAEGTEKVKVDLNDLTIENPTLANAGDASVTLSYQSVSTTLNVTVGDAFDGTGTAEDPYMLSTANGLAKLSATVAAGNTYEGKYFKFMNDITLPADWTPIGRLKSGELTRGDYSYGHEVGVTVFPFSGTIDGNNKTLTVPAGEKPLLGYVYGATVKDLNIYGEKINGYGLVNDLHGVGMHGSAIVIDSVTLKSGSSTLKSGLIGAEIDEGFNSFGGCTADFVTTIRNCTIEKGVTVGYDGSESEIGSIAGRLIGTVENCVSYATVKGVDAVGGLVGTIDNTLGSCIVKDSSFGGAVDATGSYAGGIVGGGYGVKKNDSSGPNGNSPSILSCTVSGTVTGKKSVGGIYGGDPFVAQSWANVANKISDNKFTGTVSGTENVGAIIGSLKSLNKYNTISGNIYAAGCGASKGIGAVTYVDTDKFENLTEKDGTTYFNTSKVEIKEGIQNRDYYYTLHLYKADGTLVDGPYVYGCQWKDNHNRTDDPLGADADKLCAVSGSITAYVTLSVAGEVKLMQKAVTASDLNFDGAVDVDEVLYAAHKAYAPNGTGDYGSANSEQYGLGLTKLWGDESGSFGYWLNDASCWSLSDTVKDGSYLSAFVYADKEHWSDAYVKYQSPTATMIPGKTVTLTLEKAGDDENYATVWSKCKNAIFTAYTEDGVMTSDVTVEAAADGYAVSCTKNGTYYLVATAANNSIVPAVCKLTVVCTKHVVTPVAAKAATCTTAGNSAYWTCATCGKYYSDAAGTTEIAKDSWVIKALGHSNVTGAKVEATCGTSGHEGDTYCTRCGYISNFGDTISATGKHSYNVNGVCTTCGVKNPMASVKPDDLKVDTKNKTVVEDNSGLLIKALKEVNEEVMGEIKTAIESGAVVVKVDNTKAVQPTVEQKKADGGKSALTEAATKAKEGGNTTMEKELDKLADKLTDMRKDSGKKDAQLEKVLDVTVELVKTTNNEVKSIAQLVELPKTVTVTVDISEAIYKSLMNRKVCVVRSHTDVNGSVETAELPATLGGTNGEYTLSFETDKASTFALVSYEAVSATSTTRRHYTAATAATAAAGDKVNSANTADDSQMVIWLGGAVMAAAAITVLKTKKKSLTK